MSPSGFYDDGKKPISDTPKCESFNWRCFKNGEIIKYQIDKNGRSKICDKCYYGINIINHHWYDDLGEHYSIEYCGIAVCNPSSLKYPIGLKINLKNSDVSNLLIRFDTGRSVIYPGIFFITRYISLGSYEIIPIEDTKEKLTQRVQIIDTIMRSKLLFPGLEDDKIQKYVVNKEEMQVLNTYVFEKLEIDCKQIFIKNNQAYKIIKKGINYEIQIVDEKHKEKIKIQRVPQKILQLELSKTNSELKEYTDEFGEKSLKILNSDNTYCTTYIEYDNLTNEYILSD
jgi:hypothetical protein